MGGGGHYGSLFVVYACAQHYCSGLLSLNQTDVEDGILSLISSAGAIPHHLICDFDVHVLDGHVSCYMQRIHCKLQVA